MRKMVITLLALGVFAASAAFAGTLLNEGFTYADGGLVGLNPGAPAVGPWVMYSGVNDIKIVSNQAVGGSPAANYGDGDDHIPFALQTTSNSTYACFRAMIPCWGATAPQAVYFAGFNTTANATLMMSRVYVLSQGTTGGWTFGISNTSTNATYGATPWTSTLTCDTWYTLVIKYDPTTGTSTLWVNPVNESSPSVSNTRNDLSPSAINTFFLRQSASASTFPSPGYPGSTQWHWVVDEVGVGNVWAEACYTAPVPVNGQTWGQLKTMYR